MYLCDNGGSRGGLVLPVGGQLLILAVVSGESVDLAFIKNQSKLGVLVLFVALQVLADGNRLLDKHIKILGDFRGKA